MTNLATTARNVLKPPYLFGNEAQIRAIQILAMLAELSELYAALPEETKKCDSCAGRGHRVCEECGHESYCRACRGSGTVPVQFNESEWFELSHLIKHLNVMRAKVAEFHRGAAA